jgi:hypothetical protein
LRVRLSGFDPERTWPTTAWNASLAIAQGVNQSFTLMSRAAWFFPDNHYIDPKRNKMG